MGGGLMAASSERLDTRRGPAQERRAGRGGNGASLGLDACTGCCNPSGSETSLGRYDL